MEEEEGQCSKQVQEVQEEEEEVTPSRVADPRVHEVAEAVLRGPGVNKEEEEEHEDKEVGAEGKEGM